jgi:3-hydroxyisobutyrate dehydrogenase
MEISFLGLGRMGKSMAERLIRSGHSLTVYNRTRGKALPFEREGGRTAETPSAALGASACSILMVADAEAVRDLVRSGVEGLKSLAGRTIIQMSTISPTQSLDVKKMVEDAGGEYLEAPVLGSVPEVEKGKLFVLVGGTRTQYERWLDLLKVFGPAPVDCGPAPRAAAFKLALNHLIAAETAAFAFSLGLVLRNEIDVAHFMGVLKQSALYAPQFDKKLARMLGRDFERPHFSERLLLKDVKLMIDEGRRLEVETSVVESIAGIIGRAAESGWAESDYSALYNVINPKAG